MIKKHLLFIISVVISLILFGTSLDSRVKKARFLGKTIYYPFFSFLHTVKANVTLQKQNKNLLIKLLQANKNIAKLEVALQKTKVDDFTFDIPNYNFILAEVISFTGTFKERNILINKGSNSGIKNNMPVINHNGIVGKITQTSIANSVILPITHAKFRLAVKSYENNVQGLLEPDSNGNLYMTLIPNDSEITIGDKIVSSGISSIFPKNIPVGRIIKIQDSKDKAFLKAKIKPYADVINIENVAIVYYSNKELQNEKQNKYNK